MTKEQYLKMTNPLRQSPRATKILHIANRICTGAAYILYPALILYFAIKRDPILAKALIVPLNSFIILSAGRLLINAPRPYEVFDVPPIIPKNTKGKSFPSRHVFCIFLIGMTFLAISPVPWVGIVLMVLGVFLAIVRALSGVHFPKDVIVGAICGVVFGYVGFYLL